MLTTIPVPFLEQFITPPAMGLKIHIKRSPPSASPAPQSGSVDSLLCDAIVSFRQGRFHEAICAVRGYLSKNPQSQSGQRLFARCSKDLEKQYLSRLPPLSTVLCPVERDLTRHELRLTSHHVFMLSLMDEGLSCEELLDLCPFDRLRGLGLLEELILQSLVVPRCPSS